MRSNHEKKAMYQCSSGYFVGPRYSQTNRNQVGTYIGGYLKMLRCILPWLYPFMQSFSSYLEDQHSSPIISKMQVISSPFSRIEPDTASPPHEFTWLTVKRNHQKPATEILFCDTEYMPGELIIVYSLALGLNAVKLHVCHFIKRLSWILKRIKYAMSVIISNNSCNYYHYMRGIRSASASTIRQCRYLVHAVWCKHHWHLSHNNKHSFNPS